MSTARRPEWNLPSHRVPFGIGAGESRVAPAGPGIIYYMLPLPQLPLVRAHVKKIRDSELRGIIHIELDVAEWHHTEGARADIPGFVVSGPALSVEIAKRGIAEDDACAVSRPDRHLVERSDLLAVPGLRARLLPALGPIRGFGIRQRNDKKEKK